VSLSVFLFLDQVFDCGLESFEGEVEHGEYFGDFVDGVGAGGDFPVFSGLGIEPDRMLENAFEALERSKPGARII